MAEIRHLVVVLGDQLDRSSSAFDGFDPARDVVWMCEAREEATHVWCSQPRLALFRSAMRHFAARLREEGLPLWYRTGAPAGLGEALSETLAEHRAERIVLCEAGDWRVARILESAARAANVPLDVREDRHFFCSRREFERHAKGRKQLRMEHFYREQRRRHRILMDGDEPVGGRWNYDEDNRASVGRDGPGFLPPRLRFDPDAITQAVIEEVRRDHGDHPGELADFAWPVTREQAQQALADFVAHRLPGFGRHQDAMWEGEPWLLHSQLSAALNLKLLDPREVVAAAEAAYRAGRAPLASVEGFVRQVLGWREYVRGLYWLEMPRYAERNALGAQAELPAWYWTGDVPMQCLRDAIGQTLRHGYAHHIQRLMVTGLYALLLGVRPQAVHAWYLAVYVDAVEWVELPNTLGMSQFADGGRMASKPYVASGKYIERMSDHCRRCRFDPGERVGPRACPFTTLYWDFLARHGDRFVVHPRMALQVQNERRLPPAERAAIARRAAAIRGGDWDAEDDPGGVV